MNSRFNQEYLDYIASPQWEEFRQRVLKHWKHCCAKCGKGDVVLQVHHLTYARLGRERLSDAVPLCIPCHKIADEERKASIQFGGKLLHVPKRKRKRRR